MVVAGGRAGGDPEVGAAGHAADFGPIMGPALVVEFRMGEGALVLAAVEPDPVVGRAQPDAAEVTDVLVTPGGIPEAPRVITVGVGCADVPVLAAVCDVRPHLLQELEREPPELAAFGEQRPPILRAELVEDQGVQREDLEHGRAIGDEDVLPSLDLLVGGIAEPFGDDQELELRDVARDRRRGEDLPHVLLPWSKVSTAPLCRSSSSRAAEAS